MKALAKTPVLPPGDYTAHHVLSFVADIIEQEPKRLRMSDWLSMFQGRLWKRLRNEPPACGTVACVAGWINIAIQSSQYDGCAALNNLKLEGPPRTELWNIFMATKSSKARIVASLRNYITKHEQLLSKTIVKVYD